MSALFGVHIQDPNALKQGSNTTIFIQHVTPFPGNGTNTLQIGGNYTNLTTSSKDSTKQLVGLSGNAMIELAHGPSAFGADWIEFQVSPYGMIGTKPNGYTFTKSGPTLHAIIDGGDRKQSYILTAANFDIYRQWNLNKTGSVTGYLDIPVTALGVRLEAMPDGTHAYGAHLATISINGALSWNAHSFIATYTGSEQHGWGMVLNSYGRAEFINDNIRTDTLEIDTGKLSADGSSRPNGFYYTKELDLYFGLPKATLNEVGYSRKF